MTCVGLHGMGVDVEFTGRYEDKGLRRAHYIGLILGLYAGSVSSCGVEDDPLEVDPTLFIHSFCDAQCDKTLECKPELVDDFEGCFEECTAGKEYELDNDPCFEILTEVSRCRLDRLTCEQLFDLELLGSPADPCLRLFEELRDCVRQS